MYKLCYYLSDTEYYKEKNKKVLQLLKLIEERHKIDCEISPLKLKTFSNGSAYTDEAYGKEIYEKQFKPRAKILASEGRVGIPLPRGLRSRSGSYFIAGTIAILEDEQVGWYTCWESCERFKAYDKDSEVSFLKALLDKGLNLFDELCPTIISSPHDILVDKFIHSGIIRGKFEREVKVGQRLFEVKGKTFDWRKAIDLVCHAEEGTWVFEAKPKLDWGAFGQVIAYSHLYEKERGQKTFKGIICDKIDPEIVAICDEFDISVFKREVNKFEKIGGSIS